MQDFVCLDEHSAKTQETDPETGQNDFDPELHGPVPTNTFHLEYHRNRLGDCLDYHVETGSCGDNVYPE